MQRFGQVRLHVRLFSVALAALAWFGVAATANAGTIDNVNGWAWSGTIGWISTNCTNTGTCATVDYGVNIKDKVGFADRGDVVGYAWAETVGWICFGATCTGTTPEGVAPYAEYRGLHNTKTDELWGWAKVVSLGDDGWIALNCDRDAGPTDCAASSYRVKIDPVTGAFTKGALTDHWAWGAVAGLTGAGWVDFGAVNTTWVRASLGIIRRPLGIYEPQNAGLPGTHLSSFSIGFTGLSAPAGYYLECDIRLPDNSKRVLSRTFGATLRNQDTSLSYTVQNADEVQRNVLWTIESCRLAGPLKVTACASDATCGASAICDEGAAKCRDVAYRSDVKRPVFTHENAWTGLGAAEDQYLAIKCNAGFPGNYFKNAAQCDFTGDASFSLAMRRGIPVEGICDDDLDNDGNGQIDCADRYCKGVSYKCQTLPRTSCVWGQGGDGINDCSDPAYANGALCCSRQPRPAAPTQYHVVDGLECTYNDPKDGYFDCDCTAGNFGSNADCYAPGWQAGDLCCSAQSEVMNP